MSSNSKNPVVPVTITVDKKAGISVSPDPFFVRKHQDQMVRWNCVPNQAFSVEFTHGSPFYETQFSRDCPSSGLVRRNVVADKHRIYKYTVRVGEHILDPGGGVNK